jgi:hypothetical protein
MPDAQLPNHDSEQTTHDRELTGHGRERKGLGPDLPGRSPWLKRRALKGPSRDSRRTSWRKESPGCDPLPTGCDQKLPNREAVAKRSFLGVCKPGVLNREAHPIGARQRPRQGHPCHTA